ncbi:MAG TPA: sugar phosphate isomerase/epimerase [Verrucomicrobiae bacterium]|jgi:sugar phosphate isomerase/epimerase|nr:sugar phosphate isomerase/epimerase [Verrucomicrobiae bacterium]
MHFIRTSVIAAALLALSGASVRAESGGPKLGMQTWTLRNLNFDQAMEFCAKHHIKDVELIPNHLDPNGAKEEWQKKKDVLDKNGLVAYTFGVAGTSLNHEENKKLFECAKFFGMKLIVVEPGDFKIFDDLEQLVKEYDIKVAVHNHGITSMYGNPAVLKNVLQHRDRRIGVCLDAGWIASSRMDPAKVFKEYNGRVYDIHLKDKKVESTPRGDRARDVFLGEGDAKLPELLHALQEAKWDGVLAIETDNDLKDPTEHTEKAIEFFKANSTAN